MFVLFFAPFSRNCFFQKRTDFFELAKLFEKKTAIRRFNYQMQLFINEKNLFFSASEFWSSVNFLIHHSFR